MLAALRLPAPFGRGVCAGRDVIWAGGCVRNVYLPTRRTYALRSNTACGPLCVAVRRFLLVRGWRVSLLLRV
jgi:hypothetical protein